MLILGDRIEVNNSKPVTSNAVYNAFGTWQRVLTIDSYSYVDGLITQNGKYLRIRFSGTWSGYIANGTTLFTLPEGWRPNTNPNRCVIGVDTTTIRMNAGLDIQSDGKVNVYFQGNTPITGGETVSGLYCDVLILLV